MLRLDRFMVLLGLAAVAPMLACNSSDAQKNPPATSSSAPLATAPPVTSSPPPAPRPTIANRWGKSVGLKAPESVLLDDKNDVYLVSNVDGKPLDVDGKGFISKLAPVGQGVELKWIESGKNKVVLNAPKGMAITGDTLWVADIDTVRTFHRTTGAPTGDIKIAGATFLNDMAVTPDGRVLVSDTGFKPAKDGGLEASGSDAIYAIDKDRKPAPIARSKGLGGPNGIIPYGDNRMYVVSMGTGELFTLDASGNRDNGQKMPRGGLDGIAFGRETYFISSWDANAIYRGVVNHDFEVFIEDVKSPADLMFDRKRNRLLIPLMTEDEVRAYEVP